MAASAPDNSLSVRRPLRVAMLVTIICVPLLITLLYVRAFAVELPQLDDWDILGRQLRFIATESLSWSDINVQLNESIILFPQLVYLAIAKLAGYQVLIPIYISYAFLSGCLLMLYLFFRLLDLSGRWSMLWFLPVSLFFMSWRQSEGLLWSTHLVNTMALFFSLLALYCCVNAYRSRASFLSAIAFAWVASFCMSSGLLVWPLGWIYLTVPGRKEIPKPRFLYIASWSIFGLACATCFSLLQARYAVEWPTGIGYVFAHPGMAAQYCLNYLGSPFCNDEKTVYAGGVFVLIAALSVYLTIKKTLLQDGSRAALLLVALVVIALCLLLTRRLGMGPEQALSSRYVTLGSLAPVGVYFCLLALMRRTSVARYLMAPMVALFLLSVANSYVNGLKEGRASWKDATDCAAIVRNFHHREPSELGCAYPDPQSILDRAVFLERRHLSLFR